MAMKTQGEINIFQLLRDERREAKTTRWAEHSRKICVSG